MNEVEKLQLKIQALIESYTSRNNELENKVADLRVALTETHASLQAAQQELQILREQMRDNENAETQEDVSDED